MGLVIQKGPWTDRREVFKKFKIIQPTIPLENLNFQNVVSNPNILKMVTTQKPFEGEDVADWIEPIHRGPFILQASLYGKPRDSFQDWVIEPEYTTERVALWKRPINGTARSPQAAWSYCIGLKGTSLLIDILDDVQTVISLWHNFLLEEGDNVIKKLFPGFDPIKETIDPDVLMFAGHSLGGYGAIQLASKYKVRGCSFNGAGTVFKTTETGFQNLISHYHIVGDFISSHVSIQSCKVTRVFTNAYEGYGIGGTAYSHSLDRFKPEPIQGLIDANHEDALYLIYSSTPAGLPLFAAIRFNPIPGADRSSNQPPTPAVQNPNNQPTKTEDPVVNKHIDEIKKSETHEQSAWDWFVVGAIAVIVVAVVVVVVVVTAPEVAAFLAGEGGAVAGGELGGEVIFDAAAETGETGLGGTTNPLVEGGDLGDVDNFDAKNPENSDITDYEYQKRQNLKRPPDYGPEPDYNDWKGLADTFENYIPRTFINT